MKVADQHDVLHQAGERVIVIHVVLTGRALSSRIMLVPLPEVPQRLIDHSDVITSDDQYMLQQWWIKYKHSVRTGSGTYYLSIDGQPTQPWRRSRMSVLIVQCQSDDDSFTTLWTEL